MYRFVHKPIIILMKLYQDNISALSALALSAVPALLGPLPKSMTHRRLTDLLFILQGEPENLFYLQDNTVGKYKSIKMHLVNPFLDLST